MKNIISSQETSSDWSWFDTSISPGVDVEETTLSRAFTACFEGSHGELVLRHLKRTMLDRRLGPKASDAELRFVEGQRSAVAHILSMLERDG